MKINEHFMILTCLQIIKAKLPIRFIGYVNLDKFRTSGRSRHSAIGPPSPPPPQGLRETWE